MKRTIALFLCIAMVYSLAACGATALTNTETESSGTLSEQTGAANNQTEPVPTVTVSPMILIAYFAVAENSVVDAISSASFVTVNGEAKGRVRAVADMIQSETGGDLFSIQTSVEYPGNGGELIDFAAEEQDAGARPELITHIENLDDYDIVIIGYPNWWYDMPMVMYSFFDEYDFAGKTIIPFNTHNGSRFSSTIETIQELEPNATIITDGFTVSERNVTDAAGDVADWLKGLGY